MKNLIFLLAFAGASFSQGVEDVVYWKFPGVGEIEFKDGQAVRWPKELPDLTPENLETWTAEYKAAMEVKGSQDRIDASNHEMCRMMEYIAVKLLEKGLLTKEDLPARYWDIINARREERGQDPVE